MKRGTFLDVVNAEDEVHSCPHLYETVRQRQDGRCLETSLAGSAHEFFDELYDLYAVGLWQVIDVLHAANG